jgi:hypothetical protein
MSGDAASAPSSFSSPSSRSSRSSSSATRRRAGRRGQAPAYRPRLWKRDGAGYAIACLVAIVLLAGGVTGVRLREPTLLTQVQVAVGSEDMPFFQDGRVQQEFANNHLKVTPIQEGSRAIARDLPPAGYDAFFPSSQVFAEEAAARVQASLGSTQPFRTPLAVFTLREFLPQLRADGIVDGTGDIVGSSGNVIGSGEFDLASYFDATRKGVIWSPVKVGQTVYFGPGHEKQLLLNITNPAKSDSGAMYLHVESYVLNHNRIPSLDRAVQLAAEIRTQQVQQISGMEDSTQFLFSDYEQDGPGGKPLVLGYESEFRTAEHGRGLPSDAVMIPLSQSVQCVHTVVPLDQAGLRFATLMSTDSRLLQIAATTYGFTDSTGSPDTSSFAPDPDPGTLEAMIGVVEPGQ